MKFSDQMLDGTSFLKKPGNVKKRQFNLERDHEVLEDIGNEQDAPRHDEIADGYALIPAEGDMKKN